MSKKIRNNIQVSPFSTDKYNVMGFWCNAEKIDNEYVSHFADFHASGESIDESIDNLKDIMILTYEILLTHKKEELGKIPTKQLKVLNEMIERIGDVKKIKIKRKY